MRAHIRRVKCIVRFFVVACSFLVLCTVYVLRNASLTDLAQITKCPACYGLSFCSSLSRVHLYPFSTWFNAKNVFTAHSPRGPVVLKRLGHDWELDALDQRLCELMNREHCDVSELVWRLPDIKSAIFEAVRSNSSLRSGLTFCPAVDSSQLDELIERLVLRAKGVGYKTLLANLLTTLLINPEPLILQAFPGSEGWPFPRHLGSCGRLTAQSYAGAGVARLLHASWGARAAVALQLLRAARQLTFQDPRYALYLTDISLENIAVDGAGRVTFVDLGNLIVVDKFPPWDAAPEGWSAMHTSDTVQDCEGCFSFSPADVCSHQSSDHNYYAVCQFLGENAWLADPPEDVVRSYPQLESLLRECRSPEMQQGRYVAARHLIPILANLTSTRHS